MTFDSGPPFPQRSPPRLVPLYPRRLHTVPVLVPGRQYRCGLNQFPAEHAQMTSDLSDPRALSRWNNKDCEAVVRQLQTCGLDALQRRRLQNKSGLGQVSRTFALHASSCCAGYWSRSQRTRFGLSFSGSTFFSHHFHLNIFKSNKYSKNTLSISKFWSFGVFVPFRHQTLGDAKQGGQWPSPNMAHESSKLHWKWPTSPKS